MRKAFAVVLAAAGLFGTRAFGETPRLRFKADVSRPALSFLSWDTEGGGRAETNLLRGGAAAGLRVRPSGGWPAGRLVGRRLKGGTVLFRLEMDGAAVNWESGARDGRLRLRRTLDYWLDRRMRRDDLGNPTGEITGYWDYGNFLDGDGLVEAVQSGDRGTLIQPDRSCAWWDALNCCHKDGYANTLIYRGWRGLADLESRLGRTLQRERYLALSGKLKSAYGRALFNPRTGWLAWWKSRDGELHDYASPTLNGLAIEYGLVEPEVGRAILDRLWANIASAGFSRFDLGIPPMLVPVRRSDYLQPDGIVLPQREDGRDTFGQYMNGGITAGQVLHFLADHYVLGENERSDPLLRAMLARQERGEFQNGVQDAAMRGIDWTTWDGKPSGYEGYLADSFRFLQAVLLREAPFRERLYRPLH